MLTFDVIDELHILENSVAWLLHESEEIYDEIEKAECLDDDDCDYMELLMNKLDMLQIEVDLEEARFNVVKQKLARTV